MQAREQNLVAGFFLSACLDFSALLRSKEVSSALSVLPSAAATSSENHCSL